MARKSKLKRFADVNSFPNVYEPVSMEDPRASNGFSEPKLMPGTWRAEVFKNDHPVILELACGKGDYTIALAHQHPEQNFIGVDIKGARIWKGARTAIADGIHNAAFLRTRIEFIDRFFVDNEVDEIWITFPDPFERKENRRLTAPSFLQRYRRFLKPGGIMHLKTDADLLYEFTLDTIHGDPISHVLYANPNIYASDLFHPDLAHKTFYEAQHLRDGRTIKYIRFTIN